jgi:hypothetical protein
VKHTSVAFSVGSVGTETIPISMVTGFMVEMAFWGVDVA